MCIRISVNVRACLQMHPYIGDEVSAVHLAALFDRTAILQSLLVVQCISFHFIFGDSSFFLGNGSENRRQDKEGRGLSISYALAHFNNFRQGVSLLEIAVGNSKSAIGNMHCRFLIRTT